MALTNMGFNDKFGLILEDQNRRERREGEKREEEEEEEEEKKKRRRRKAKIKRYGTMTFIMDLWNFKALYG